MSYKTSIAPTEIFSCTILGLVLAIAAAFLQSNFGKDYANYLLIYDAISPLSFGGMPWLEFGFRLLMGAFKALGLDYLSAITLIIWISITYKLIFFKKYSPNFMASVFLYVTTFLLLHEATQVRISISTTFLFYACAALAAEKRAYFFAFVLAATLFHYAALAFIAVPIVFFAIKNNRVNFFECWLAAGVAGLAVFYILWPLLSFYFPNDEAFNYLPIKLSAYLTYRTNSGYNYNKMLIGGLLMALCVVSSGERYCYLLRSVCYSAFVLSFFSIIAFHQRDVLNDRFSELFLVPLVIYLPTYLTSSSDFKRAGIVIYVIISLFVPSYFFRISLFNIPSSDVLQSSKDLRSLAALAAHGKCYSA